MEKVLKILQNTQQNTCATSVSFNKVGGLWPTNLLKKRL